MRLPLRSTKFPNIQDYRAGTLLTGQLKAMCIKKLQEEVKTFQEVRAGYLNVIGHCSSSPDIYFQRRAAVTDEMLKSFMDPHRAIDPSPSFTGTQTA
jgi:tryptophanyl-tRNA synthetase